MAKIKGHEYESYILDYYKKIAAKNGLSPTSSMQDQYIRDSEIAFCIGEIERYILEVGKQDITFFEVGCGNGHLLAILRERFPKIKLFALEFTPELYTQATSREIPNCQIVLGDARDIAFYPENVDLIISERVIINILSRKGQFQAFHNIANSLLPGGRYIQIESYSEPLAELNSALKEMLLDGLEESRHNKYLYEKMLGFMHQRTGLVEIDGHMPKNFLSTHFYVTRVFHKSILPKGGKVKFSRMAKFFVDALPIGIGNYSPILFRVFQKN